MKILKSTIPLLFMVDGSICGCGTAEPGERGTAVTAAVFGKLTKEANPSQPAQLGVQQAWALPGPWELRAAR